VTLRRGEIAWSLLPQSGGSRIDYVCHKFGVRIFRSSKEFNDGDFSSRALVLRGMCTQKFWLVVIPILLWTIMGLTSQKRERDVVQVLPNRYSICSIKYVVKIDLSKRILVLDTSILPLCFMERRE
jgi:hypothetical protein